MRVTAQIKELFNYRSPDAKVFPRSLAFNALPRVGPFAQAGFTEAERFFARGLARLLGGEPKVTATRAWIPSFSALSGTLRLFSLHRLIKVTCGP